METKVYLLFLCLATLEVQNTCPLTLAVTFKVSLDIISDLSNPEGALVQGQRTVRG